MRASSEHAKRLILEGDGLMNDGQHRLDPSGGVLTDLDSVNVEQLFVLATNIYVAAALEYQRSEQGEESLSVDEIKSKQWLEQLGGPLAAEVRAARQDVRHMPKATAQDSALQAQAFAENVRDRFARARPELFNHSESTARQDGHRRVWVVGR